MLVFIMAHLPHIISVVSSIYAAASELMPILSKGKYASVYGMLLGLLKK
jgi:hypothetical protein